MGKKPFQPELVQLVFDACSLIYIAHNGKMADLRRKKGQILIPEKVAEEIRPEPALKRLLLSYPQIVTKFQNSEAEEYLQIIKEGGVHEGEAAAITIALKRRLQLVIDDQKAKTKAENHGIKTLGWQDFVKGS